MNFKNNRPLLVLGSSDAITARLSWIRGADYIWASSFILSSSLGFKDEGIIDISDYLPLLKALIKASNAPVILDLDIIGRNKNECCNQLDLLKELSLGGVCIEDEGWPKFNAMLASSSRKLISVEKMSQKIFTAKKILNSKCLVIARTHSLIVNEPKFLLQKRIDHYIQSGADVVCVHYTGKNWDQYQKIISDLNIIKPLMVIFSKNMSLPKNLDYSKIGFVVFPNQIYRMMLYPIIKFCHSRNKNNFIDFKNEKLVDTKHIFKLADDINK